MQNLYKKCKHAYIVKLLIQAGVHMAPGIENLGF